MARDFGRIIGGLLLAAFLLPAADVLAQDEPEYRTEVGAGAGLITYTGDFNGDGKADAKDAAAMLRFLTCRG